MIPTVFSSKKMSDNMLNKMFDNESNGHVFNRLPRVNILEYADKMEIELAVPGLKKEDININLEDNVLSISAHKEISDEEKNYVKREFGYNNFKRVFNVSNDLDQERIEAQHENGVLNIIVPKKETAIEKGPRSIEVK